MSGPRESIATLKLTGSAETPREQADIAGLAMRTILLDGAPVVALRAGTFGVSAQEPTGEPGFVTFTMALPGSTVGIFQPLSPAEARRVASILITCANALDDIGGI